MIDFTPRYISCGLLVLLGWGTAAAQSLTLTPFHESGIYKLGEPVGWTAAGAAPTSNYRYTLKKNGATVMKSGKIDATSGPIKIETTLAEPATVYLEITSGAPEEKPIVAGAAIAPTQLRPAAPRPADFDVFWAEKIKLLTSIPVDPVVTPGDSGKEGVEYSTVRLNNIQGSHVYGQLAKPARAGTFPAMLILLWASPPYPFSKQWVTDRAAEGWLALNVEPHDVPGDLPATFYSALPQMIKEYNTIYDDDRDRNYFLRMYLGDYRALDYLASRPDWNGKVMVVTGTSMGGQQSFVVAGLHPKVTHMITHVAAGADTNAALHDRMPGYPNWKSTNPKVMETALYFDTVNFAPRIHATSLVSIGFVDTTCPSVGLWTAFNQIAGKKEPVPLRDSPHNNLATVEQQRPFTERSTAWFASLQRGEEPTILPSAEPVR